MPAHESPALTYSAAVQSVQNLLHIRNRVQLKQAIGAVSVIKPALQYCVVCRTRTAQIYATWDGSSALVQAHQYVDVCSVNYTKACRVEKAVTSA